MVEVCNAICNRCYNILSLSELALRQPAVSVAWMASKTFDAGKIALVVMGGINYIVQMHKNDATLQGRKIEKIEVPKEEFANMQKEILRLHEENAQLKKEISLLKEKDAIVERVLLPNQKGEIQSYLESICLEKKASTSLAEDAKNNEKIKDERRS